MQTAAQSKEERLRMDPNRERTGALTLTRSRLGYAAVGLGSAAVVGLMVGMGPVGAVDEQQVEAQQAAPVVAAQWEGYADLIEQVMPSVVGITAQRDLGDEVAALPRGQGSPEDFFRRFGEGGGPGDDMMRRFFERFFGDEMPEMPESRPAPPPRDFRFMPPTAMGSGFIIDEEGLIVTNNHVVAGASTVTVQLDSGVEIEGEVIGRDPETDLALIRIETDEPLQAVRFADSASVRVGDPVIAIGSPFGLGGTVTAGIVSAHHRTIGAGRYDDFIQIDAPINRGNSGGPTFNTRGEVIGVNTAIQSPTGGSVGIGFAIPANLVMEVVEDLREDGYVTRGWLGVMIQGLDADLAAALGLDQPRGALVSGITPDSPAAQAGFEQGDLILEFDGQPIESVRDLTGQVARTAPGTAASVLVLRNGAEETLTVDIGKMPVEDEQVAALEEAMPDDETPRLGLSLSTLTPDTRESFDLGSDATGVLVTDVAPGSPAAEKGLRPGDVIVEANRESVSEPREVSEAVRDAAENDEGSVLLLVRRDGQDRFVALPVARG
jgi:serine protease Do